MEKSEFDNNYKRCIEYRDLQRQVDETTEQIALVAEGKFYICVMGLRNSFGGQIESIQQSNRLRTLLSQLLEERLQLLAEAQRQL